MERRINTPTNKRHSLIFEYTIVLLLCWFILCVGVCAILLNPLYIYGLAAQEKDTAMQTGLFLWHTTELPSSFDEKAIIHMYDVRNITDVFLWGLLSGIVVIVLFVVKVGFRGEKYLFSVLKRLVNFLRYMLYSFGVLAILFPLSFTWFHMLLFDPGSWVFSYEHILIRMFPWHFFLLMFCSLILYMVVIFLLLKKLVNRHESHI